MTATPRIPTSDEIGAATSAAALAILTDAARTDAPLTYRALRRWHATTGSRSAYIHAMVAKATADKAPDDALYKRDHIGGDGSWVTVRDLAADHPFRLEHEGGEAA